MAPPEDAHKFVVFRPTCGGPFDFLHELAGRAQNFDLGQIHIRPQFRENHRAGPGGTGAAKCGGNYASSLMPMIEAGKRGFDQVMYLDAVTSAVVEELGGMNVFIVLKDGTVATPVLNGTILEGVTRSSIIDTPA